MRYMKLILVGIIIFSLMFTLSCKKAVEKLKSGGEDLINVDLAGLYNIKGTNPDNSEYEGTLNITKNGDAYSGTWQTADLNYDGVAIRESNYLVFAFADADRTWFGVCLYKIEKSGALNGVWASYAMDGLGTEIATKMGVSPPAVKFKPDTPIHPIEASYNFTGTNVDGSEYSGTVTLQKTVSYFDINWKDTLGNEFIGLGIPHKNIFAVATAEPQPPNFGVCVYKLVAPDKLEGLWTANAGDGKLIKENWSK
ncbi:MAG: hypothetical protein ACUVWP_05890 [bacterium]